jgi:hypothetical protein
MEAVHIAVSGRICTLKTEIVVSSKMLVSIQVWTTTWCCNPQDSILNINKFCSLIKYFIVELFNVNLFQSAFVCVPVSVCSHCFSCSITHLNYERKSCKIKYNYFHLCVGLQCQGSLSILADFKGFTAWYWVGSLEGRPPRSFRGDLVYERDIKTEFEVVVIVVY